MDDIIARMEQDLKDLDRSISTRQIYLQIARRAAAQLSLAAAGRAAAFPNISIEDDA